MILPSAMHISLVTDCATQTTTIHEHVVVSACDSCEATTLGHIQMGICTVIVQLDSL